MKWLLLILVVNSYGIQSLTVMPTEYDEERICKLVGMTTVNLGGFVSDHEYTVPVKTNGLAYKCIVK